MFLLSPFEGPRLNCRMGGRPGTWTHILALVVVFLLTKPLLTLLARTKFYGGGHPWSGLDPKRLGARPPLRRTRRPSAPIETKEA